MPTNRVAPHAELPRTPETAARRRPQLARRKLLFIWSILWLLQIRSFTDIVLRHKIREALIPPPGSTKLKENVTEACFVRGLHLAGIWWGIEPTHFFKIEDGLDGTSLCHFVVPFFNIHGSYRVNNRKVSPISYCANDSYLIDFVIHHGSVGYYAFYIEGGGSICGIDHIASVKSACIGSSDLNSSTLANFSGNSEYQVSYYFGCMGMLWLAYRAVIVSRSFVSCRNYAMRLDTLQEPLSFGCALIFIQQASRIVPHAVTNWHRLGIVYFLIEGLMTDLFMIIASNGIATTLQFVSLAYGRIPYRSEKGRVSLSVSPGFLVWSRQ